MIKSRSRLTIIIMISISLILTRCNRPNTVTEVAAKKDTGINKVGSMATKFAFAQDACINPALPNLWVDATNFSTLRNNVAFRFFINDSCDITLKGWEQPYHNSGPAITLETSTNSGVSLTTSVFLGNLYLKADLVQQIQREVEAGSFNYIIFQPVIDRRPGSVGQVIYKVRYVSDPPTLKGISADSLRSLLDTSGVHFLSGTTGGGTYLLNPSPPRDE